MEREVSLPGGDDRRRKARRLVADRRTTGSGDEPTDNPAADNPPDGGTPQGEPVGRPRADGCSETLAPGVHLAPWRAAGEPVLMVVRRDGSLVGHHPWVVPQAVLEETIAHAWRVLERLDAGGKAAAAVAIALGWSLAPLLVRVLAPA